ncbi:hypothetical protein KKG72_07950 [bacterium]|nr:hypothetical protein [bacterium]MBU1994567.1 hypothetical protein [bacterium]
MIFIPEVLTLFILNVLFIFFAVIAFVLSVKIFLKWDLNSTCQTQYELEKQSFLTATIIKYIFVIKVPLFLFFIFTLDKISHLLTGAMCGAGVVDATEYGTPLFILKIINLYLFAFWLVLHNEDIKHENQPYTKVKFGIFILAFFLFISELLLEGVMFSSIDIDKMVSCCGTLYSSSATSYVSNIFSIQTPVLLALFYGNFALLLLFYFLKNRYLFAISNIVFIIVGIIALIAFFGTYIYELPTHHCPFCFLQKDYYYVGYLIYTSLFIGTFYGLIVGFIEASQKDRNVSYRMSLVFNFLYVILLSAYPLFYYLKNGVWL